MWFAPAFAKAAAGNKAGYAIARISINPAAMAIEAIRRTLVFMEFSKKFLHLTSREQRDGYSGTGELDSHQGRRLGRSQTRSQAFIPYSNTRLISKIAIHISCGTRCAVLHYPLSYVAYGD